MAEEQPKVQPLPPSSTDQVTSPQSLSADVWAHILQYSYFHEVLALTATCKFFHHDVPPTLNHLLVSSAKSMDVTPASIVRFSGVEKVYVYSLIKERKTLLPSSRTFIHVDQRTVQTVMPFLSNLPKVAYCHLGGRVREYEKDRIHCENGIRCDEIGFSPRGFGNATAKLEMARLITIVCKAYKDGDISHNFEFNGLIPSQNFTPIRRCGWKSIQFSPPLYPDLLEESRAAISDINNDCCQICGLISTFFPPLQVMQFCPTLVPCVPSDHRLEMGKVRDPDNYQSNLTTILLNDAKKWDLDFYMCPPDFETKKLVMSYDDSQIFDLKYLVSKGANIKDNRLRELLVGEEIDTTGNEEWIRLQNKRILEIESFEKLKSIGFDISEKDFFLLDTSDKRTSVYLHNWNKMKDEFNPERALKALEQFALDMHVDIEEIRRRVKRYIDRTHPNRLTLDSTREFLRDWLGTDNEHLDIRQEAIVALWLEAI